MYDSQSIIDNYDLTFDPGDALNGSLYLCELRDGASDVAREDVISALRSRGLWSPEAYKQIADDQRQAYKDGLQFVSAVAFSTDGGHFLIARFDHPKFPSDAARWAAWVEFFEAHYDRYA